MSSRDVTVAAIQCPLGGRASREHRARREARAGRRRARGHGHPAARALRGAVLLPRREGASGSPRRAALDDDEAVARMRAVARELGVVVPVSFFERAGQAYYNSVAHRSTPTARCSASTARATSPTAPGTKRSSTSAPATPASASWTTRFGTIGVGICWDQWFPESARAMMLLGAEVLFYPTAIGSEPHEPDLDTRDPWQRAMVGHAVSNIVPVVAANRIGRRGRADRSTARRSSPMPEVTRRAELGRTDEGVDRGDASTSTRIARTRAVVGLLPRPPPRALRRAHHGRRQPPQLQRGRTLVAAFSLRRSRAHCG